MWAAVPVSTEPLGLSSWTRPVPWGHTTGPPFPGPPGKRVSYDAWSSGSGCGNLPPQVLKGSRASSPSA